MVQTRTQVTAGPKAQLKHKLLIRPSNPKETLAATTINYQTSSIAKHQLPLHQAQHLLQRSHKSDETRTNKILIEVMSLGVVASKRSHKSTHSISFHDPLYVLRQEIRSPPTSNMEKTIT